jgi:chemotaxis protein CheZ
MATPEMMSGMYEHAQKLMTELASGNATGVMQAIEELNKQRDKTLYFEIGRLTRSLHDAIVNFKIDEDAVLAHKDGVTEPSRIDDAFNRLNFVIDTTEKAANRTMDLVEASLPVSQELGETAKKIKGDWQRLIKKELTPDEFRALYKEIDHFLTFAIDKSSNIEGNLSSILMAQDFQDITGQVIKKVIKLVKDVEENLVGLIRMAADVESLTGIAPPSVSELKAAPEEEYLEGPVIDKDRRQDVAKSQDDVDDLLSSLGF